MQPAPAKDEAASQKRRLPCTSSRSSSTQSVPAHGCSSSHCGGSIICPGSAGGNCGCSSGNTPAGSTSGDNCGRTCNRLLQRTRRRRRGDVVRTQAAARHAQSAPAHSHTDSFAGSTCCNCGGGGGAATRGGGEEIAASAASNSGTRCGSSVPLPSYGTAANVEWGVAQSEEIHPKPGANRTGRLQNSPRGQSCLLEEILYQFVACAAFGPPHFNRNPIYVANDRVML